MNVTFSSVSHAAALLHLRRGPPAANHAAAGKERGAGEQGENQVPGESKTSSCPLAGGRAAPVPVPWLEEGLSLFLSHPAGGEEEVLQQQTDEDQPPSSAELLHHPEASGSSANGGLRPGTSSWTLTFCTLVLDLFSCVGAFLLKCF